MSSTKAPIDLTDGGSRVWAQIRHDDPCLFGGIIFNRHARDGDLHAMIAATGKVWDAGALLHILKGASPLTIATSYLGSSASWLRASAHSGRM